MNNKQLGGLSVIRIVTLILSGILIGGGAILPGISGGVLCVIFGIYKPMMAMLSHPKKEIPKYWKLLLPVGIGWLIGFFVFAKVIELIFGANETLGTWLFIGLIAGEIPALLKEAGSKGRTKSCWIALAASTLLLLGFFMLLKTDLIPKVEPTRFWQFFAGVLWGLSLIVPGMSSSSTLMALGLYVPIMTAVGSFKMDVIGLWFLGLAGTVALLARLVTRLFDKHYGVMYHIVAGMTIASTLSIVPLKFGDAKTIFLSALCFAVGLAIALFMGKLDPDAMSADEPEDTPEADK